MEESRSPLYETIIFLVLLLLFISSIIMGQPRYLMLGLIFIYCAAIFIRELHLNQRKHFLVELDKQSSLLEQDGTVIINGVLIRKNTELCTYFLTVGMFVTSIVIPSPYRSSDGAERAEGLVYAIISLLSGWWALPTGPLLTLASVKYNLSGGMKIQVAKLLKAKSSAQNSINLTPPSFYKLTDGTDPNKTSNLSGKKG